MITKILNIAESFCCPFPNIHADDADAVFNSVKQQFQLNGYSCGVIAAWSVIKALRPKSSVQFASVYKKCKPDPKSGLPDEALIRTLRHYKLKVETAPDFTLKLIHDAFRNNKVVIACIKRRKESACHWVTICGYSKTHIYVNNNYMGLFTSNSHAKPKIPIATFKKLVVDALLICGL